MVLQKTVPAHKAHCVQEQAFFLPMLDIITFNICISLILSEHQCHFSTSGHLRFFCELPVLVLWPFICWKIKLYPVIWRDSAYFRLLCMLPLMAVTCPLSLVYSSCLGKFSPLWEYKKILSYFLPVPSLFCLVVDIKLSSRKVVPTYIPSAVCESPIFPHPPQPSLFKSLSRVNNLYLVVLTGFSRYAWDQESFICVWVICISFSVNCLVVSSPWVFCRLSVFILLIKGSLFLKEMSPALGPCGK